MKRRKMSRHDLMLKSPMAPLIGTLAVPSILTMLVTSIYNMADTAFVGRLGTSASGAVGVVFGFMGIIQAFGFMMGMGSGSIISRALGQGDNEKAARVASTGVFLSFSIGGMISILSILNMEWLLGVLGSTPTIDGYARIYLYYIMAAAPFMTSSFSMNQILRYEGKAALGMAGIMTGGILNMIGDPILMFGFGMGIAGAGLSTAASQIISFVILINMFMRGRDVTRLSIKKLDLRITTVADIMITGLPSLLRQGLMSISVMLLNGYSGIYGDAAIAAMSIVNRMVQFIFSVALGIGQGFQPVCGYNYGAERYDRVKEAYKVCLIMSEALISVMVLVVIACSGRIIGIFRDDPLVIEIGTRALRLQAASLLFIPISMGTEMMYQSTGNKAGAIVLAVMRGGLLFIPSLIILSHLRGISGIQEAQAVAFTLSFIPAIIFAKIFFNKLDRMKNV